ncbi:hypothetical protein GF337_19150 [candidate division KSB1 bacterium]|nr:hypothetical protein [candidate division KSB1 bacterium]
MQHLNQKKFLGFALIIFGLLFYLETLGVLIMNIKFPLGTGIVLIGFLLISKYNQTQQIRFIGLGLLSLFIGLMIFINGFQNVPNDVTFALLLFFLSSFSIIAFFMEPEKWWYILPGAVLFIFAIILIIDAYRLLSSGMLGFVFLFGLSLLFTYLYLIRTPENKLNWAKYPAGIIFLLSLYVLSEQWDNQIAAVLFPISLIALGIYFSFINFRKKSTGTNSRSAEALPDE